MGENNTINHPSEVMGALDDIEYDIAAYEYSMTTDKSNCNRDFCETKIKELIARRENITC